MTTKDYLTIPKTTSVVTPTSKKFIQRAREKRDQGEDYQYWVRAARIIHHIDLNIPVGFDRVRRGRRRKGVAR